MWLKNENIRWRFSCEQVAKGWVNWQPLMEYLHRSLRILLKTNLMRRVRSWGKTYVVGSVIFWSCLNNEMGEKWVFKFLQSLFYFILFYRPGQKIWLDFQNNVIWSVDWKNLYVPCPSQRGNFSSRMRPENVLSLICSLIKCNNVR